jgi:hypothetical protein
MHATATYTVIDYHALRVSRITNVTASRNIGTTTTSYTAASYNLT